MRLRSLFLLLCCLLLAACGSSEAEGGDAFTDPAVHVESSAPEEEGQIARVMGQEAPFFGGTVQSWAEIDASEDIVAIGVTVSAAVLEDVGVAGQTVRLSLPNGVEGSTFVNHLQLAYTPEQDTGDVYDPSHIAVQFFGITPAERAGIDCTDLTLVPSDLLPASYIVPEPAESPETECVPLMGYHAVDSLSPENLPENPQLFTSTLALGVYGGKHIFLEPMVTRATLLEKNGFSLAIPTVNLPRSTPYPTVFHVNYDAEKQAYDFVVSGF